MILRTGGGASGLDTSVDYGEVLGIAMENRLRDFLAEDILLEGRRGRRKKALVLAFADAYEL